jgi:hypothetical protein
VTRTNWAERMRECVYKAEFLGGNMSHSKDSSSKILFSSVDINQIHKIQIIHPIQSNPLLLFSTNKIHTRNNEAIHHPNPPRNPPCHSNGKPAPRTTGPRPILRLHQRALPLLPRCQNARSSKYREGGDIPSGSGEELN